MPLTVKCQCGELNEVHEGGTVHGLRCRTCGRPLEVPSVAPGSAPPEPPAYLGRVNLLCLCGSKLSLPLTQLKHVQRCAGCGTDITTVYHRWPGDQEDDALVLFARRPDDWLTYEFLHPQARTPEKKGLPTGGQKHSFSTYEGFKACWREMPFGYSEPYHDTPPQTLGHAARYLDHRFEVRVGTAPVYRIAEVVHQVKVAGASVAERFKHLMVSSRVRGEWVLHDGLCYARWDPAPQTGSSELLLYGSRPRWQRGEVAGLLFSLKRDAVSGEYGSDAEPAIVPQAWPVEAPPHLPIAPEKVVALVDEQAGALHKTDMLPLVGDAVLAQQALTDALPEDVRALALTGAERPVLCSRPPSGFARLLGAHYGFLLTTKEICWWNGPHVKWQELSRLHIVLLCESGSLLFINRKEAVRLGRGAEILVGILSKIAALAGSRWHGA